MPTAPTLYCDPNDVYEYVSEEAAQLRLDDQNQASGQQVAVTAAAAVGAVSLTISALQYPLLRGTTLVFSAAGMDTPVTAVLSAAAAAAATALTVVALDAAINAGAMAADDGVNTWKAMNMLKACRIAADKVNSFCLVRYTASQLITSYVVQQWAVVIASRWLAKRRYMPAPSGIESDYEEAINDLQAVRANQMDVAGLSERTSAWPFVTNLTLIDGYTWTKLRVEPTISENTPTQYPQMVDWASIQGVWQY